MKHVLKLLPAAAAAAAAVLLVLGAEGLWAAPVPMTVNRETTVFISSSEPQPLQLAAQDLVSDMTRVFGGPIRVVHDPAQASPTTIWISFQQDLPSQVTLPTGWEQLRMAAVSHPWPHSACSQAMVLTGSDVRGAIYAIYQFSQQFLGVDPLYWWTDNPPTPRQEVTVPAGFSLTQGPAFHNRGFFINDEDLLTGWHSGIPEGADISLKTWNRIFEAILRLKGDMVIPGTWIFPYEPQIRAAMERGLIVSQHHVNVLGLDTYQWPRTVPYSFPGNAPALEAAWRTAVEQYPAQAQIVWSVGFRGLNDYPFWRVEPNAPTTAAGRAQVIQQAIAAELNILRSIHPHARVFLNAWREAAQFLHQGLMQVPPGVILVWPDNGHGTIQDHGEISGGEGVYYHTAMIDGLSNHFSELVPLTRIQEELGRAARAGATQYLVVNTSNLRPVPMTSEATMELAWNPQAWMQPGSGEAERYMRAWDAREFGARAAGAVVQFDHAYFAAPAHYGLAPDARMGDHFYESASRRLLVAMSEGTVNRPAPPRESTPGNAALTLRDLAARWAAACRAADYGWKNAEAAAERARPLVAPDRRMFFQANVLTQVELNLHGNRMLMDFAQAALASDFQTRIGLVQAAIGEGEAEQAALRAADYGKWHGFYTRGDWLLDHPLTVELARAYVRQLQGHPPDRNLLIRARDGAFAYHMITAYQGGQKVQFTLQP